MGGFWFRLKKTPFDMGVPFLIFFLIFYSHVFIRFGIIFPTFFNLQLFFRFYLVNVSHNEYIYINDKNLFD
jgi:hypothetical protein